MKHSLSYVLSALFTTFMIVLVVCIINAFSTINKANAYHQTCIAEIQASNFSSAVIQNYQKPDLPFKTVIIDRTIESNPENLEKTGRIYEVKTTYKIEIPVINYKIEKTIIGYAR